MSAMLSKDVRSALLLLVRLLFATSQPGRVCRWHASTDEELYLSDFPCSPSSTIKRVNEFGTQHCTENQLVIRLGTCIANPTPHCTLLAASSKGGNVKERETFHFYTSYWRALPFDERKIGLYFTGSMIAHFFMFLHACVRN